MRYPKTIALDFDGTCVQNNYPQLGKSIGAEKVLIHCYKTYNIQYMLWTMRTDQQLQEAVDWLRENTIPIWAVNENPTQSRWSKSPKRYANLYVDDTGLGMPLVNEYRSKPYVEWDAAGLLLEDWCEVHAGRRDKE